MPNLTTVSREVPLVDVLKQISIELVAIANTVNVVEETISRIACEGDSNQMMVRDLQSIDVVSQSLRAIASFALNISQPIPKEWQVDVAGATDRILLTDLAKRLTCIHLH
jgi:hypothetical protein